jgi:hypothetical protein
MSSQETNSQVDLMHTDTFDAHIVPAETKARKEREGESYKHTPGNVEDPASIHTADGYTVDTEGLINNYAVEPPMYVEEPGDLAQEEVSLVEEFTIVDVFDSHAEAENAAIEIHKVGISKDKISIFGKGFQDVDHGRGFLNWEYGKVHGGLAKLLASMGIDRVDAMAYEVEGSAGKTLVIVVGKYDDVIKAQKTLVGIGHRLSQHQTAI